MGAGRVRGKRAGGTEGEGGEGRRGRGWTRQVKSFIPPPPPPPHADGSDSCVHSERPQAVHRAEHSRHVSGQLRPDGGQEQHCGQHRGAADTCRREQFQETTQGWTTECRMMIAGRLMGPKSATVNTH